ncbi:MAG: hypothetical protein IT359_13865 [Gemmatimonadaceae bacterium]|nr:hypothetical protein [Gemmatimonadaceae bacterium]
MTRGARLAAACGVMLTQGALLALTACGTSSPETNGAPRAGESSMPGTETLLAAPMQLAVGDDSLSLEVEAWRSFQPLLDSASARLIAVLRVSTRAKDSSNAGSRGVPGALGVDAVWLVRGSEVVRGEAREEQPREAGVSTVEFVLRDGPTWAVGDSIDVVVTVSGVSDAPRLLRAPRVAIARVD